MTSATLQDVYESASSKMDGALQSLTKHLIGVRGGQASPAMMENVKVSYYGQMTPMLQVGAITAPEAQLLVVNPWDKGAIKEIERSIQKLNLGGAVSNDGNVVRLTIPSLTEERRQELAKQVRQIGEEHKVAIRNIRRDANDEAKQLEKNKAISEDDLKQARNEIQKMTDQAIEKVSDLIAEKEQEILTI